MKTILLADDEEHLRTLAKQELFTKFYRVDNAETRRIGGTGLGLALVKEIAVAHGGRVWVENARGEGTTFHLALPRAEKAPDAAADEVAARV